MLSRRGLHSISALGCRLERKCRHPSGWSIPHGSRTWIVAYRTMSGCPPMMTMKISSLTFTHQAIAHCIAEVDPGRSEERRVGKECRAGGAGGVVERIVKVLV